MPTFRRIKIRATVETPGMLVPEHQVDAALDEIRNKLKEIELAVVSIETTEPPPLDSPGVDDDDAWSMRGQPAA